MSETTAKPDGHNMFTVADVANQNAFHFDNRPDADDKLEKAQNAPGVEPKLFPPGECPAFLREDREEMDEEDSEEEADPEAPCGICGEPVKIADAKSGLGRKPIHPDCYAGNDVQEKEVTEPLTEDVELVEHVDADPEPADMDDLPERTVADDPLSWMPGHFVDEIDGKPAINRKGFEVLAQHYNISTTAELEVPPEETDHEYVRVKARAVTEDGREAEAYGSAHVDRGDDPELLLEMADTRARKRALSIATGVGVVAVAELKTDIQK